MVMLKKQSVKEQPLRPAENMKPLANNKYNGGLAAFVRSVSSTLTDRVTA